MRTIKFRAWNRKQDKMYDWDTIIDSKKTGTLYWISIQKDENILMQFTGLLDKNGKEIYEGDIVRMSTGRGRACKNRTVEYRDGAFRYPTQLTKNSGFIYSDETTEIIGNIYENPDLLSNN